MCRKMSTCWRSSATTGGWQIFCRNIAETSPCLHFKNEVCIKRIRRTNVINRGKRVNGINEKKCLICLPVRFVRLFVRLFVCLFVCLFLSLFLCLFFNYEIISLFARKFVCRFLSFSFILCKEPTLWGGIHP